MSSSRVTHSNRDKTVSEVVHALCYLFKRKLRPRQSAFRGVFSPVSSRFPHVLLGKKIVMN